MVEKIEKGDSSVLRRNPTPIKSKISPFKQNVKKTPNIHTDKIILEIPCPNLILNKDHESTSKYKTIIIDLPKLSILSPLHRKSNSSNGVNNMSWTHVPKIKELSIISDRSEGKMFNK